MARTSPHDDSEPCDAELISRVRQDDDAAFAALYRRHATTASRYAKSWTKQQADADDLVAEAFTRVLQALRNGNGPADALLPYLLTTMRHVAVDWHANDAKTRLVDDFEPYPGDAELPEDTAVAALDRTLAARAFASLPERWQAVLWHSEVEGDRPAAIAPILGIDATAVSALAYRAREGLRQAYLQAHITSVAEPCRPYARHLGEYVRGGLSGRNTARVAWHIEQCPECHAAYQELLLINSRLGAVLVPVVLGGTTAATLAATTHGVGAGHTGGAHTHALTRFAPRRTLLVAATAATVAAGLALALSGSASQITRARATHHRTGPTRRSTAQAPRPTIAPTPHQAPSRARSAIAAVGQSASDPGPTVPASIPGPRLPDPTPTIPVPPADPWLCGTVSDVGHVVFTVAPLGLVRVAVTDLASLTCPTVAAAEN